MTYQTSRRRGLTASSCVMARGTNRAGGQMAFLPYYRVFIDKGFHVARDVAYYVGVSICWTEESRRLSRVAPSRVCDND